MREFAKKRFDVGGYLSRGYEIFKRNPWLSIGFTVVFLVIISILNFIPVIGTILNSFISPALAIGFAIIANRIEKGHPLNLSNGFDGFQKIVPFIIYGLILLGISILFFFLIGGTTLFTLMLGTGGSEDPTALIDFFMSKGLFLIVSIFLYFIVYSMVVIYAPYFIYFENMQPLDALKASVQLAFKNPFRILVFFLLSGIIFTISILLIVFPVFAAIPIVSFAFYAAWKDQSGYEDGEDSSSSVIDNLV